MSGLGGTLERGTSEPGGLSEQTVGGQPTNAVLMRTALVARLPARVLIPGWAFPLPGLPAAWPPRTLLRPHRNTCSGRGDREEERGLGRAAPGGHEGAASRCACSPFCIKLQLGAGARASWLSFPLPCASHFWIPARCASSRAPFGSFRTWCLPRAPGAPGRVSLLVCPRPSPEPGGRPGAPEIMEERTSCFSSTTLFRQEGVGGITYRIPALLYIPPARVLLAFAEKRSTVDDTDALYLVLRQGQMVGHSVQWGPQVSLTEATLPGFRTMNPCPVWEQKSGRVILFFICVRNHVTEQRQIYSGKNAARLCFVSSEDHGLSWSQIQDLTEEVVSEEIEHWATFAVGPGHGIQLQSGRLVIPAYAYHLSRWSCLGPPFWRRVRPHSLMFYSDDLGATWKHGQLIEPRPTIECAVAEVTNSNGCPVLYCSARTPGKCRAEALSTDLGEHFEKPFLVRELHEPPRGCQGSVVSFRPRRGLQEDEAPDGGSGLSSQPASPGSTPDPEHNSRRPPSSWLIYSHPTSKRCRVNLGIYLNQAPLEATLWSQPWIFHRGPSGYSDLAALEEGLFGCLFECGEKHEYEQITFRMFTDQELLSHIQDNCLGSERASHSNVD
ncbi:sialidase-3 isoform X2 [Notamacropus eugenii]|uniref:sialidase-3 isoform X2 n=1 Tax=Notamacropus eugenii TaxID=9315 RepID=UPI003B67D5D9